MADGELWARAVIFILVGLYTFIVLVLTVKYVVKNCLCSHQNPHWNSLLYEYTCRRHRGFVGEYYDEDLPQFEAALKYPIPEKKVVLEIEPPPPTYDEYVSSLCQTKVNSASETEVTLPGIHLPNFLEIDEGKNHM